MTETTEPEQLAAVWTFGGSRIAADGKRAHVWVTATGEELWFAAKGSYTVGSQYDVMVSQPEPGRTVRHGTPAYHGRHPDETVRLQLAAADRAAAVRLRVVAMERADKRDNALDAALEPLCKVMRSTRGADRDALLAHIIRRLSMAG